MQHRAPAHKKERIKATTTASAALMQCAKRSDEVQVLAAGMHNIMLAAAVWLARGSCAGVQLRTLLQDSQGTQTLSWVFSPRDNKSQTQNKAEQAAHSSPVQPALKAGCNRRLARYHAPLQVAR